MTLPEIVLSNYFPQKTQFWSKDPFCIAFVYPKYGSAFVVKGMCKDVMDYCKQHAGVALVNYTFWHQGNHRSIWTFVGTERIYVSRIGDANRLRHCVSIYNDNELVKQMSFRRMPRKWIPEFNFE